MPTSPQIVSAISWLRAPMPSDMACRNLDRSCGSVCDQVSNAVFAALAARSTSSAVPSGIRPMTSSVEALITSIEPVPDDGTHAPSM